MTYTLYSDTLQNDWNIYSLGLLKGNTFSFDEYNLTTWSFNSQNAHNGFKLYVVPAVTEYTLNPIPALHTHIFNNVETNTTNWEFNSFGFIHLYRIDSTKLNNVYTFNSLDIDFVSTSTPSVSVRKIVYTDLPNITYDFYPEIRYEDNY